MNTHSKKSRINRVFRIDNKLQFEKELIQLAILREVQKQMDGMSRAKLAKRLGLSASFVSQLFSGDKMMNLDLMARLQRALKFKFIIESKSLQTLRIQPPVIQEIKLTSNLSDLWVNTKGSTTYHPKEKITQVPFNFSQPTLANGN